MQEHYSRLDRAIRDGQALLFSARRNQFQKPISEETAMTNPLQEVRAALEHLRKHHEPTDARCCNNPNVGGNPDTGDIWPECCGNPDYDFSKEFVLADSALRRLDELEKPRAQVNTTEWVKRLLTCTQRPPMLSGIADQGLPPEVDYGTLQTEIASIVEQIQTSTHPAVSAVQRVMDAARKYTTEYTRWEDPRFVELVEALRATQHKPPPPEVGK